ncbi:MAG: macro domain-containing protein [Xenococcaceae cyanobacterium]
MKLYLVDTNPLLVDAWSKAFAEFSDVQIEQGNILEVAENTIVSPTNSYGFMDGGLDRLYIDFFGVTPQNNLRQMIQERKEGYLPVGSGVLVHTGHHLIPYTICVPTMLMPEAVPAANSFYAMIAVLRTAVSHCNIVKKIFCPGLATGIGGVEPEMAAQEMVSAYRKWQENKEKF